MGLQKMMDQLNKMPEEYEMKINIKTIKIMRMSNAN